MPTYDYLALVKTAGSALREIEGRVLREVFVQVLGGEYNQAWLVFEDCLYVVTGCVGSEVLGIRPDDELRASRLWGESQPNRFAPFDQFAGRTLVQARMIGEAWNGHGFEFTFEGLPTKSMLFQSIYSSPKPDDRDDCMRLGVGHYSVGSDDLVHPDDASGRATPDR